MDTNLITYLKEFLKKNDLDGLLVNSTNEYLVEYNKLELNSRYYLTDFTGSTGDVLFTQDKIYLFVDSRYHEQADNQVNHDLIEVVKIPLKKSYINTLLETIPAYFKLGIVSSKVSKIFFGGLENNLKSKNSSIRLLNTDPVIEYNKDKIPNINFDIFKIPEDISGLSADEKYETIKLYAGDKFNIIVNSLEDIAYLTNLRSYSFDYSSIFPAKAIITQEKATIYSDCEIPEIGTHFEVKSNKEFEKDLSEIKNDEIYVDNSTISIHDFMLINPSNKLLPSRLNLFKTVKNENEINHFKECFKRSDKALIRIYDMLNEDKIYSEYDYYEALVEAMEKEGAKSLSFKPIVAGGSNSSIIHYTMPSKDKMIRDGDFLLVDYGGYYEGGYATDTTRTFIKGIPSENQKIAYTTVLKAFLNAYNKEYKKKSAYFDIDKTARDTIEKSISEEYKFAHSTGHGVGISVHEHPPIVSSTKISQTKIIEHTIFSIEPGVYKEGWGGIRLENTVYAEQKEDKMIMHSFSHFPFEIKLVNLSMLTDWEKYYYMKWQAEACVL